MGISSEFQDGIFVVRIAGQYQPDELVLAIAGGFRDPRFTRTTHILFDARGSIANPSLEYIEYTTRQIVGQRPEGHIGRWAVLAGNSPLRFGIARMREICMENVGVTMYVFTDPQVALDYLRHPVS